jgi:hypothetical protein
LPTSFWVAQFALALPCLALTVPDSVVVGKLQTWLAAPRKWEFILLGVSPVLLASTLWQLSIMTAPVIDPLDVTPTQLPSVREAKETALTDRGRQIHLFELKPESKESFSVSGDSGLPASSTPVPYRSIRLTEANGDSNCVGWVFTGGRHLLQCSEIEMILEDNGYREVKTPQSGDLVIYRDESANITHAGRVAFILNDGQTMIKSKWGYQGIFLHLPDGSPFGLNWTYYRSARPNQHLLLTNPTADDEDADPAIEPFH